jgi:hypothetical protein
MRRTKEEWARIVENHRSSGLSVRRFCKDKDIGEHSLYNRIKRIDNVSCSKTGETYGFVEVQPAGTRAKKSSHGKERIFDTQGRNPELIIRLPDNAAVEVYPETDRGTLEWVLNLMAKRS